MGFATIQLLMHKWLQLVLLTLYTLLVGTVLLLVHAPFFVITALLSGAPMLVFWNRLKLQSHLVPITILFTVLGTALIELYAYRTGVWYELSPLDVNLFGGAPLDAYIFSVVHILYFIVLYEYFLDDNKSVAPSKFASRGIALFGIIYAGAFGYLFVDTSLFIKYPFILLILIMSVICGVMALARAVVPRLSVVKKAATFSLMVLPLSIIFEVVMTANNIRIFANAPQYLYSFSLWGNIIPVEEFLMILLLPFGLVFMYELYLDDGK